MGFPKSLMSSAVLAGVVFCSATVPLAALNSKTVTVQVNEQPVMMGQLQDFAPPYLGFATLLSLGTGIVSLSALGWRQSSKKLESATGKAKALEQKLQEQAYAIENLKFSDRRLMASGLDTFLTEESHAEETLQTRPSSPQTVSIAHPHESALANEDLGLEASLEQTAAFIHKTASGGEVSSVFKASVDTLVPALDTLSLDMGPDVEAELASTQPPQQDEEQLNALMGQLQQMMSQLEQIRDTKSPVQSAA